MKPLINFIALSFVMNTCFAQSNMNIISGKNQINEPINDNLGTNQNKNNSKGLIADYPFSGSADDVSGNNNNGIVFGAVLTTDRFGNENSAYLFDGENDYIAITPISYVGYVEDFTILTWFQLEQWDEQPGINANNLDRQYIFDGHTYSSTVNNDYYRDGFYTALNLDYDYNEYLMCGLYYYDFSYPFYTKVDVTDNWHFMAYVKQGNLLTHYFDTTLVSMGTIQAGYMDMQHEWYIGTFSGNNPYYDNSNYNFHGKIDDIIIYDYALSKDEIYPITTSNSEPNPESGIKVYPNPANTCLYVKSTALNKPCEICIYTINGQMIFRKKIFAFPAEINISDFPEGVYVIQSTNNSFSSETKFIKIKQ